MTALRVQLWTLISTLITIVSTSPNHPPPPQWTNTETVPAAQSTDTTKAKFTATSYGLDAPHVHPINASAYEWFYFDAVSPDGQHSVVFTFYTAPATGFLGGGPPDNILGASINVGTPSDSLFFFDEPFASEAVIQSAGNGASGRWVGTGFEFEGASDLSSYAVRVASPDGLVKGSVEFTAVAPPHYPCGPVEAGVSMEAIPHLGWAVGMSDAIAEVNLVVNGTVVKFTGVGYHDKNWGDQPFATVLQSSIWGHAHLGPFSLVWTAVTNRPTGKLYSAGYVACHGEVLTFGCSDVTVAATGNASRYGVEIALGRRGVFAFEVEAVALIEGADGASSPYGRWTGRVRGGIKGEMGYSGVALYEHFEL